MKKLIEIILGIIVLAMVAFIAYKMTPGQIESDIDTFVDVPGQSANLNTLSSNTDTSTSENVEVVSGESEEVSEENEEKNMKATLTTNKGIIEIELFGEKAPKTVENFVTLAESNFYDGVKFHRVINNFMIQTGDPQSKDDDLSDRWGTGGPGYKFDDELPQPGDYKIGSLAMANSGPNTNGSQFFIVTGSDGAGLPPLYSLFGEVTAGLDVALAIQEVETFPGDRPVEPVIIESITIVK